jgi:PAS domain S-box-containing protein
MTDQDHCLEQFEEMRRAAERKAALSPEVLHAMSTEEIKHTMHELQVHQIELEMQNENLRALHQELDASRARYFDLYDLAPVGYCTLSEKGLILEANLIAATLLGFSRSTLINQPLSRFILKDDQDVYYLHRKQLFETGNSQACDLRIEGKSGGLFWAHLEAAAAQNEAGEPLCRIIISDISEQKQSEETVKAGEIRYQQLARHLDAVLENEHKYFARELHDDLGQTLTALKIDLAVLKNEGACNDEMKNKIDAMQTLLSTGIQSVHSLCRHLRPGALDDLGLGEALAGMIDEWKRRNRVECTLCVDIDEEALSDNVKTAVFRAVQEALTNVSRHACGSEVEINLVADEQTLNFSITDHGDGIETGAENKLTSFGLLGMRERLEALNGELQIKSAPGKGTQLEGSIPLTARKNSGAVL